MQNDKLKKIIPILIIIVLLGLGALAYFLFFKNTDTNTNPAIDLPVSGNVKPGSGNSGGSTKPGNTSNGNNNQNTNGAFSPTLRLVYDEPVGGGVTFERGGKNYTRFVERTKGNVYETDADNIKVKRLTNNTIAQLYNAYWTKNGEQLIGQYLRDQKEIQTFVGSIKSKTGGEGELQTQFLSQDLGDIKISPDDNKLAFLSNSVVGSSLITSNLSAGQKVEAFNSPLNEWLVEFPNSSFVTVTSKADKDTQGLSKTINLRTGEEEMVLSGIKGLTTLFNSDLKKVLYSQSVGNSFESSIIEKGKSSPSRLKTNTLPEKCVWSEIEKNILFCATPQNIPEGNYPKDWYLGLISFKDELWKINTTTGETNFLINLSDSSGENFDAYKISLSKNEKFITLVNKNNLKLYTVQITK